MSKEAMNLLTMTDEDLVKHASKQVQALRMALDMIECEKHDRRHVRWAIIDALKEEAEQPAQQEPWGVCVSGRVFVGALPEYVRKLSEDEGLPIQWLYTSPPASKPWVGLTDKEIEDAWPFVWREHESVRHFAIYHAIETKLRQKNT